MTARQPRSVPLLALIVGGLLTGSMLSAQSRTSVALSEYIGDPFLGTLLTVFGGSVLLALTTAFWRPPREGLVRINRAVRENRLSGLWLLAGVGGVLIVLAQAIAAGPLGLALFAVGIVSGQMTGGITFDALGIAGNGAIRPTALRVIAALLAVAAGFSAVVANGSASVAAAPLVIAFVAGIVSSWTAGANGRVLHVARNVVSAGLVNHLAGMVVIALIVATTLHLNSGWHIPTEPWLYCGSLFGIGALFGATLLVRHLGVLLLGVTTVTGQLVAGLALDALFPTAGTRTDAATIASVALTVIAVGLLYSDARRR
ncbi:DMT family transporter [Microbacterium trichothecenolyticum]|uniref:DMT family transporter n=1 Tax=Microbacterium trichothecenolyticum TaxID=69370 RepID=UPI001C6F50FF|nr:DMT family transporter [Microbacterium trichothecenolyticum]MBW9122315.1 DMT family transporter [Microbacterium trichothecenolyticum]